MLILSLDSAGAGCGACVWRDGRVLAEMYERMARGQDQRLMPLVMETTKKADVGFDQLDRIAVTRGPGSFTGLRIGLAAARGIGLASGKPVLGIDRFSIYRAAAAKPGKNVLVVIDSRRAELFCRFYPAKDASQEPCMMAREQITAFLADKPQSIVVGDVDLASVSQQIAEHVISAQLAAEADAADPQFLPRPLYIRPPDVTFPKDAAFELRPVTKVDAPLLAQLHAKSFESGVWSKNQIEDSLALDTTRGWLAHKKREMYGFVLCQMLPGQAEILTLCVHPKHRRKGIATRLMQPVLETAQARIVLEVAADNAAAIKLYEKLGFSENGRRRGYYKRAKAPTDAVLYQKVASAD